MSGQDGFALPSNNQSFPQPSLTPQTPNHPSHARLHPDYPSYSYTTYPLSSAESRLFHATQHVRFKYRVGRNDSLSSGCLSPFLTRPLFSSLQTLLHPLPPPPPPPPARSPHPFLLKVVAPAFPVPPPYAAFPMNITPPSPLSPALRINQILASSGTALCALTALCLIGSGCSTQKPTSTLAHSAQTNAQNSAQSGIGSFEPVETIGSGLVTTPPAFDNPAITPIFRKARLKEPSKGDLASALAHDPYAPIDEALPVAIWDGPRPAKKPRGVIFEPRTIRPEFEALAVKSNRKKKSKFEEMGPPPPGYIKITGEPVPNWDETRNQYENRASPFSWTFMGPKPASSEYWSGENNAGGRVVSIAPHPIDPDICYIASASGGIWKTTDGGTNWNPLTDELSVLNHGAVTLDPSNPEIVVIGTGEYQQSSNGDGAFRSTDGGQTWDRIATRDQVGSRCSGIAVSATNSDVIHFAGNVGYSRTTNGGTTWTRIIDANCSALELDPSNSNIVYVARRANGIYKSTNAGQNFTKLAGGLPTSGFDRIVMDISRSNPQVLYAAFIIGSNVSGIYKTVNGGTNWTPLADQPNFCAAQCWYDAYIGVDPTDPNVVYVGGVDPRYSQGGVLKSINGGASWVETSQNGDSLHPDHHAIEFGPGNVIWEANDGGISKSLDGGANWINLNNTLAVTQMYHAIVHPVDANRIMGGTQDNGTPERTGNSLIWPQLQVGDGGYSVFDPSSFSRRYTTYVYLAVTRWNGSNGRGISGEWEADSTNWISPIIMDPNSTTTLYAGTERIWRTTNATDTSQIGPVWTAISDYEVGEGETINNIAIGKTNSNIVYVGNGLGGVWVTTNAGAPTPLWESRSAGLPVNVGTEVSSLIVSPNSAATAFVSYYRTSSSRIFRTDTTGGTWRDVTGNLPTGVGVRSLAVDFRYTPPVMYVGSGAGIYVSFDEGDSWIKDDHTFPNVNIGWLHIDERTSELTAGTYGRGVWRTPLANPNIVLCIPDFNNDGGIDGQDIEAFFTTFEQGFPSADVNQDGGVDGQDIELFFTRWESGEC